MYNPTQICGVFTSQNRFSYIYYYFLQNLLGVIVAKEDKIVSQSKKCRYPILIHSLAKFGTGLICHSTVK